MLSEDVRPLDETLDRLLQHPRQLRAPRPARIIHVVRDLLWAICGNDVEPIDQLSVAPALL